MGKLNDEGIHTIITHKLIDLPFARLIVKDDLFVRM